MPAATTSSGGSAPASNAGGGGGSGIPFIVGTNHYQEKLFTVNQTLDTNSHEFVFNITPGGFLRGIRLYWSSVNGALGAGTLNADGAAAIFSSISLENIDGSPILYPQNGYAWYIQNLFSRPWEGDPKKRSGTTGQTWSDSVNPAGTLKIYPSLRDTLGCLANTDARAQFRLRFTVAPLSTLVSGGTPTAPSVTITGYMEAWAQTDQADLHGNPIEALPSGLCAVHLERHQVMTLNSAGANNTFQLTNTGNEIRNIIAIVRDNNGARQDYFTDPIRWRLDNRQLEASSPDEVFHGMEDFYPVLQNGTTTRPVGVYVWPRFRRPGDLVGQFWLPTANATFIQFETATASGLGGNTGTVEWQTSEIVPMPDFGPIPVEYEGI